VVAGIAMAALTMGLGKASVLYTFYPPMIASPFYYFDVVLVVLGSWIWVALMSVNLRAWKRANPGAYLWAWTSVGAVVEVLVLILPASLGLTDTINAGLARVLFSWTLHAIVYFWLMPSYIAFYTLVPRAIGGRLYSDMMGRVSFVLFLVFSMPIGIHHLFADPQVGAGFKFVHAAMTAIVSVPTLLTVFTITASVEIAGRLRGGKGLFGWVKALPWERPMMLAHGLLRLHAPRAASAGLDLAQPLGALQRGRAAGADAGLAAGRLRVAALGAPRLHRPGPVGRHLPRGRRAGRMARPGGRGATLALNCTMCHGAQGQSASSTPNLAGQYPEVVIKQLRDYQSGKRRSTVMEALARNLSEREIADLAAYYASLPKARIAPTTYDESLPALVRVGDPLRNIAPCIACHGGVDQKLGAPWIEGMPQDYLAAQLGPSGTAAAATMPSVRCATSRAR
jgi:cytochrome c553